MVIITEAKQLCSGIFWVISDNYDLSGYKFLMFDIPCGRNGISSNEQAVELNSKSGKTYNHKKLWDSEVKNKSNHRPYNKKDYNYYPRGRVEIVNDQAIIYLNPHINKSNFITKIKKDFGLFSYNISKIRVISDGSAHYECFLDWE